MLAAARGAQSNNMTGTWTNDQEPFKNALGTTGNASYAGI